MCSETKTSIGNGQPRVTVVVPVFNGEKHLRQCLDSVVQQTLADIEIIVVNDGSTDSTGAICAEYSSKDSRVVLVEQPNGGLASARNAGLRQATGEYVGFVDADDWVELDMYERMYGTAVEHSADIVFCNCFINETTRSIAYLETGNYDRSRIEAEVFPRTLASFDNSRKLNGIRWSNCLRIYSKDLIDRNGISFDDRFRRCQDLPFTFECTIHAKCLYYLGGDYLYHNRYNTRSLSKGYTENMWSLLKPVIRHLNRVVERYGAYDFSSQLGLRAFMFAVNSVENEAKPGNIRSLSKRIQSTRGIVNDPITREIVAAVEMSGANRTYRLYQFAFKHRLSIAAYFIARRRLRVLRQRYRLQHAEAGAGFNVRKGVS